MKKYVVTIGVETESLGKLEQQLQAVGAEIRSLQLQPIGLQAVPKPIGQFGQKP